MFMKIMHLSLVACSLMGLAACSSPFQAPLPGANVEELERQAPVSPTPNPTGQIYDQTLNQDGGTGFRNRGFGRGFF